MRHIRVRVSPRIYARAFELHHLWREALREARDMIRDGYSSDMWYEMDLYRTLPGIEGVLEGAYWRAFTHASPSVRRLRNNKTPILYIAYRSDCPNPRDVHGLLRLADLDVAYDDAVVISDSHAGAAFSGSGQIFVCATPVNDYVLDVVYLT